jgi:hypothetical protein
LREQLRQRRRLAFDTFGGSMAPCLPSGCTAWIEPLDGEPRAGQLLVFVDARRGELWCHRVQCVRGDGAALTRGDARRRDDGWVDAERFVGRLTSYEVGGSTYDATSEQHPSAYRRMRHRLGVALSGRFGRIGKSPRAR